MYGAAMSRAESVRFDRLLNHVRHVVAGAEMFEPRSRRKIITKADHLWQELRKARKLQVAASWARP
jgi:hypothetical protein